MAAADADEVAAPPCGAPPPADGALETTRDALLNGALVLTQPRVGYRVNVDALLLAAFATRPRQAHRALDLGCGVGAVGLALLAHGATAEVTLVDRDDALLDLARVNIRDNGHGTRASAARIDLLERWPDLLTHRFDLVVSNPPYGVEGATRLPLAPRLASARVGSPSTLLAFAKATRQALGRASRACFVFPARDLERLLRALAQVGLEPKRLRMVHAKASLPARVVLVEAKPGRAGGLVVESPAFEVETYSYPDLPQISAAAEHARDEVTPVPDETPRG